MKRRAPDKAAEGRQAGYEHVRVNPLLAPLLANVRVSADASGDIVPDDGWIAITYNGDICLHPRRVASAETWGRLLAVALVSYGFSAVRSRHPQDAWELATLLCADNFCDELKIGRLPDALDYAHIPIPAGGIEALFRHFCADGIDPGLLEWYQALRGKSAAMFQSSRHRYWDSRIPDWQRLLAEGIAQSVGRAIRIAGGVEAATGAPDRPLSKAARARRHLIDVYPLLGAMAAEFLLEEDPRLCQQQSIQVAAISIEARKIWLNPAAGLSLEECQFVLAHELLHAGLAHASRRRGRDPFLWNVACDFVINGWLMEMQVGSPPLLGMLYDQAFAGLSAEDIYDNLSRDMRRARKLATLRGTGVGDLMDEGSGSAVVSAEDFCRRALYNGLERCLMGGQRGTLPAGLIEEIRALAQPPIPWDVKLAEWFDERFPPLERIRSYARPSRRQSAAPDIPRPSIAVPSEDQRRARVFGVVLDTSGSMSPVDLGKAIGAIASYAMARDVYAVRLVHCDAHAHDDGWIEPENLLGRVSVRGRGGTVLQPGIDCLRRLVVQGEFPENCPVLLITDGMCEDRIDIPMDHAFLLTDGRRLPFSPRGPVFFVS